MKQKEFRDSVDQLSLGNIENVLEKTLELTQNPGCFSTVVSLLANISSLDLLMTSARKSLANVKVFSEKSMQVDKVHVKELENELQTVKSEAEDLNRVYLNWTGLPRPSTRKSSRNLRKMLSTERLTRFCRENFAANFLDFSFVWWQLPRWLEESQACHATRGRRKTVSYKKASENDQTDSENLIEMDLNEESADTGRRQHWNHRENRWQANWQEKCHWQRNDYVCGVGERWSERWR